MSTSLDSYLQITSISFQLMFFFRISGLWHYYEKKSYFIINILSFFFCIFSPLSGRTICSNSPLEPSSSANFLSIYHILLTLSYTNLCKSFNYLRVDLIGFPHFLCLCWICLQLYCPRLHATMLYLYCRLHYMAPAALCYNSSPVKLRLLM